MQSLDARADFKKTQADAVDVPTAINQLGHDLEGAMDKFFAGAAQNDAQLEGIAVQLGGWLEGATQCTSFAQARGWAFAFLSIADTVAQAIRDWLAQKAGGAIGHAFGNAWKPTHSEPRTIGEMREELVPVDRATRREISTQLEANLKPALDQGKPLTPDQHSMWAMLNAVDEQAAGRLRSKHKDHARFIQPRRVLHARGAWQAIDSVIGGAMRGFIAFGPEYSRHRHGPLHAYVADSVAAYLLTVEGDYPLSTMPFELADSANFFQILGYPIADSVLASLAPLLERIDTDRREHPAWHWHRGFMALALRVEPVWRGIAGLTPGVPSFTADAAFGPNVQGLLAYLGAAIEMHASLDAVMPAGRRDRGKALRRYSGARERRHVNRTADVQDLAAAGF